jgi:hypothetical protein
VSKARGSSPAAVAAKQKSKNAMVGVMAASMISFEEQVTSFLRVFFPGLQLATSVAKVGVRL